MSDSGSTSTPGGDDPYAPKDPGEPTGPSTPPPPPPPQAPGWGSTPPPAAPDQPAYGQPQYGQQPYGQPQYGQPYGAPAASAPPNYLVPAILATVFCCLPLGIASIVFAAQVNGKYAAGDYAGAQESSRKAKRFAVWSAVAGAAVLVLYLGGLALAFSADSAP